MSSKFYMDKDAEIARRFNDEFSKWKEKKHFKSTEEALKQTSNLKEQSRETVSKYCHGKRKLQPDTCELFAKEFGVRPEYILCEDDYRTEADRIIAKKKKTNIKNSVHNLMTELGYADFYMESEDYNQTFPENTRMFLEYLKGSDEAKKDGHPEIIVDVNNDTYISVTKDVYENLAYDVAVYLKYRISQLFENAHKRPMPTIVYDDGSGEDKKALHPVMSFKTKDGKEHGIKRLYVPTSQLPDYTMEELIEFFGDEEEGESNL